MLYSFSLFSILEVLLVIVPALLSVAYVTVAERKTMASMQRRVGPNKVGIYGLLQALKQNNMKRVYHTSRGRKIWFSTPTFQPPGGRNS
jgi:NADH:ubiquinone oxidoreductase subunit H